MRAAQSSIEELLFDNMMGARLARPDSRAEITKTEKQADMIKRRCCSYTSFRDLEPTIELRLNAHEHQEDKEQQKTRCYPEHPIRMARSMVSLRMRTGVP
jgi:hypothetical protein